MVKIALISDTHGVWKPQLAELLPGVDAIIHAGDVGSPAILQRLESMAPVYAVRGNCDTAPVLASLPLERVVELGSVRLGVLHGHQLERAADFDSALLERFASSCPRVLVHGHTHEPRVVEHEGVTIVNPGAISQYTRERPAMLAFLALNGESAPRVEFVEVR